MDIVYKKIADTFELQATKDKFTTQSLPFVRTVDINLGQPDNPEGFEIFYPAMFVSWSEQKASENEPMELTLEFHVIQEPGAGTEGFSTRLPEGLAYIRVLKTIQAVLNSLKADNTSKFRYVGKRPNITEFFRYHILQYRCFIDETIETGLSEVELTDYDAGFNIKQKTDEALPTEIDVM